VLNRIRRAVTRTRARYVPKGRHRRRLASPQLPVACVPSAPVDGPTVALGMVSDRTDQRDLLRGEDTPLVRPYLLAWEKRVRQHSVNVVAGNARADTRSVLLGVR
jgi:hypothetical protein